MTIYYLIDRYSNLIKKNWLRNKIFNMDEGPILDLIGEEMSIISVIKKFDQSLLHQDWRGIDYKYHLDKTQNVSNVNKVLNYFKDLKDSHKSNICCKQSNDLKNYFGK